jgi:mannose-1-phosphate guanylyltransferase
VQVIPTIICGGAGSRLWPVSREQHPKPFIRLADGQSLLQKAYLRAALPGVSHVLTVTNRDLHFKIKDEFQELGAARGLVHPRAFRPRDRGRGRVRGLRIEAATGPMR